MSALTSSFFKASSRWLAAHMLLVFVVNTHAQVPLFNSYPTAKGTVYLDFDGQTVNGTAWNWEGAIAAQHCQLSEAAITEICNRVAEDFRIFNLNITTDPAIFLKAPMDKRMRLILTPTYQWYGHAGGVAFVNSFTWGDDTPAWVFTVLLDNNPKYIAEAASHEIGHTLGLQHQSTYSRSCALLAEYAEGKGDGEIGWAPIMGVGYYRNYTTWTYGSSIEGCKVMQNDIAIIGNGLNQVGFRTDDFGNSRSNATILPLTGNKFSAAGLINGAQDKDFFKIQLLRKSRLQLNAAPASIGANNEGANADLLVTISKSAGDTVIRSNPKFTLSASIDTMLNAGTYYIGIDGANNQNVSDYGSVGWYTVSGFVTPTATNSPVLMRGGVRYNTHILSWDPTDKSSIIETYLETSMDGIRYLPVTTQPLTENYFELEPLVSGNVHYRLRLVLPDTTSYYSNDIVLSNQAVTITSTIVRDYVQVNSAGDYQYQLFDELGRQHSRGRVTKGMNTLPVQNAKNGILLLKLVSPHDQLTFKLIKQ